MIWRFDLNAKKFIPFIFIMFMFSSCCTCGKYGNSDVIERNSRAVGKLEATITELDGTIADSRERIAKIIETSRSIEDGIDRIEYLFNEYESEVELILDEIDGIRNGIEAETKKD